MSFTIYAIQNKVNKKIYVGRTENPVTRFQRHLTDLKGGRHNIEDMQEDYNKLGDVFEFFILEEGVEYANRLVEYKYMKKYRTCERAYGYNYKDNIANRITFDKVREISCKTEAEIINPSNDIKSQYISAIIEHLNRTDDIGLLDLIFKLTLKSQTRLNDLTSLGQTAKA